jgi:hypothetical protein
MFRYQTMKIDTIENKSVYSTLPEQVHKCSLEHYPWAKNKTNITYGSICRVEFTGGMVHRGNKE